jgi:acetyltransferase-like isoleucine patch superfamily enzyme
MKPAENLIGIVNVLFGNQVQIVQPVNLYGCTIGNNCFIGPFTEIQSGVVVGDNCRIQSHSFISAGVEIGNDCFIAHGVMFINDDFKTGRPAGDSSLWRKTKIGNHVSIGSNATIMPVFICDHVVIGAGAVVVKNITQSGTYAGNPAKLIRKLT